MTTNAVTADPLTGRPVAELYRRRAWVGSYFRDFLGIGGDDGFCLGRSARRQLVQLLPGAEVAHLAYMTGRSARVIERDRADLGLVNENRAAAGRRSTARKGGKPRLVPPVSPLAGTYEWLSALPDEDLLAIDADLHRVLRERGKEGKA